MGEASDLWNSMPKEYRLKARPCVVEAKIWQLEREKDRIKRRYRRSSTEIDEDIKCLKVLLAEYVAAEEGRKDG